TFCAVSVTLNAVPGAALDGGLLIAVSTRSASVDTPVPLSETACGLPLPLSVSATAALRCPAAVGLKMTLTVHVPFIARVAGLNGHVWLAEKSAVFGPVIAMPAILKTPGPAFVTVTA